jgi:geranylgeranyl diphosphate synthase type I
MITTTPAVLSRAREEVEPALREAVARLVPELRAPVHYHLGWADANGTPVRGGGGKGIRAALALLSAETVGAPSGDAVPGAVALELVHNFSLLHDDVIDNDRERRHRPTVWALFGVGDAIITGDALLALALEVLLDGDPVGGARAACSLVSSTSAMIAGQALDMAFESRLDVSLDECLAMEDGKTGALIACAASIGARLTGAPDSIVAALEAYGHHLGFAFQAVDDLLGIWGSPDVTGKPVHSDLRQRKKALPLVFALERGPSVATDELRALFANGTLTEPDVQRAAELVQACGGRECTERFAEAHFEAALTALDGHDLVPDARAELLELAHFVVERQA